jgi:hypothetical protein
MSQRQSSGPGSWARSSSSAASSRASSGALHEQGGVYAEEVGGEVADLGEMHVIEDDRDRAESLRESWEAGPPEDARDDAALDEDRAQEPGPDDWR